MSNKDLISKLKTLVGEEKRINAEIIRYLIIVSERRIHLEMAYESLFAFCVEFLGYSEAAASRRVQAVKLSSQVPSIPEKIENGSLTFNAISKAQSFFKQAEIKDVEFKKEVLSNLEGKSLKQSETYLKSLSNQPSLQNITISEELYKELKLLQAKLGKASLEDLITALVKEKNEKLSSPQTPQRRSPALRSRYVAKSDRRALAQNPQCSYIDPKSGRRCPSKYRLEVDHIVPFALGGATERGNLQLLCKNHNLYLAEKVYGKAKIQKYIQAKWKKISH